MSKKKKPNKNFKRTVEKAKKATEKATENGYMLGVHDTIDLFEAGIKNTKGVGPTLANRILESVAKEAEQRRKALNKN